MTTQSEGDERPHHPAVHFVDDVQTGVHEYDRRRAPRCFVVQVPGQSEGGVFVEQVGDVWRVSWKIPPRVVDEAPADASWDFRSEDDARKAAGIIAGWTENLSMGAK